MTTTNTVSATTPKLLTIDTDNAQVTLRTSRAHELGMSDDAIAQLQRDAEGLAAALSNLAGPGTRFEVVLERHLRGI